MKRALFHGLGAATLMLALVYYWFAVADRYAVFLYMHVDNVGDPPALAFDPITIGRYWMAGFVAGAVVAVLYVPAMALAGRRARRRGETHRPPPAWLTWLVAVPLLVAGIPWITMTRNAPTMPPAIAVGVTLAALAALALALAPGRLAAQRPVDLLWLAAIGFGLEPVLTTWRAVELPARGIFTERQAWAMMAVGVAVSWVWLWGGSRLYLHSRIGLEQGDGEKRPKLEARAGASPRLPSVTAILWAGLTWHALGQPLAHHILAPPPGYRYITSAGNIFAESPWVWGSAVLVAAVIAAMATRPVRRRERGAPPG